MDPKDCCDPHLNATCPRVLPCCRAMIESNRRFYRKGVNDSHDIRLIHSTIYTIIGTSSLKENEYSHLNIFRKNELFKHLNLPAKNKFL